MAIIKCPECGHDVSDRAKSCPHCGVAIAGMITTCPDCGEVILKDSEECPNCHCPILGTEVGTLSSSAPVAVRTRKTVPDSKDADKAPDASAAADSPSDAKNGKKAPRVKRSYTAFIVSLVIALIVVLLGLYFYQNTQQQNELRAYNNAVGSGEPAVLQNFLDMYADAPKAHRDTIQFRLDELKKIDLEWSNAVASKSKSELLRYIERHPGNVHITEARLLVDSIDWQMALTDNNVEAFQLYMDEHPDGQHADEARDQFAKLDALRVKTEDRTMLRQIFSQHFSALARRDEAALVASVSDVLQSYMSKEHATPEDVVAYMRRLFENGDISSMSYSIGEDWQIVKSATEQEGQYVYTVTFPIEQRIERGDLSQERIANYKVTARVSPAGRIIALNMQRVVARSE